MKPFAYFRSLVSTLFHRRQEDRELDEEIRAHIQQYADDLERSGLPRLEAERRARIAFGSPEKAKEQCRDERPSSWLDTLWQDVRYGLRQLRRSPGFTTVAVVTLALGIGSATAVFSVVDRVLFRSLPYPQDDRLVSFGVKAPFEGIEFMLAPEYVVLRSQPGLFQSITSLTPGGADCDVTEQNPVRLNCALVESNFLSTLGISPLLGRDFTPDDDLPKAPQGCTAFLRPLAVAFRL